MAIIYKITNNINGKIYIGKTIRDVPDYYGSGIKITHAIKKYGIENFSKEILVTCDPEYLDDLESYFIWKFDARKDSIGYNISIGGTGGNHYWNTLSEAQKEEHRKKIRAGVAKRERKPHSEETKRKMREAAKNRTPEQIEEYAARRRKEYKIFDHLDNVVYTTNSIPEFCSQHPEVPNSGRMYKCARDKKSIMDDRWSCRRADDYPDATAADIFAEVEQNKIDYKKRMIESRRSNAAEKMHPSTKG